MKQLSVFFSLISLAFLLGQTDAQAGFVTWSYDWSRVPTDIVSADVNGTSRISLSDEPLSRASGSANIVATTLRTTSTSPAGSPNNFKEAAYSLTLRLTDDASGQSGALTFTGLFNGALSSTSADLSTSFTSLTTTQALVLGSNEYVVTVDNYIPPAPPDVGTPGSIGASVEVRPGEQPNDVPEPSTVVLSCFGLSCVAAASWRRWRCRKRAAQGDA